MFDFLFAKPPDQPHLVEEGPYTWAEISGILNRPGTVPAMLDLRTQNPPPLGAYYLPKRLREPRYFIRWRAATPTARRREEEQQRGKDDSAAGGERKGRLERMGTKKRARRRIRKERREGEGEEEVFDEKAALRAQEDLADVVREEEVYGEKAALFAQFAALPERVPSKLRRQGSLARAGERLPAWMRPPSKPRREFTVVRGQR
ncbi:hypothetical protein NpNSSI1_00000079 [Neofusicoccum parvum]|uniref:Uncharacterized protein n=1 Tax=Botryosphaeria parva (strain UCR-NP2) TaxID=1287680 RepID=R1GK03_BOTPV|nr:hypothetical protein UCRNP2_4589 [Neofusicoccum parvum UCRNP2]GME64780.1 hypothetical protein NpNSSI1_00000079 [Neofusicoccum parvum]